MESWRGGILLGGLSLGLVSSSCKYSVCSSVYLLMGAEE